MTGSDGALWFTNSQNFEIGRVDTSGNFTLYQAPPRYIAPYYIAASPDGSLWFTNSDSKTIGHIVLH